MKTKISFILVIILIMATQTALAESPREQFKQMVGQLQTNPRDDALREKIIKFARTIKPAPGIPEEAERFEGRAQFAFKNAKSSADYLDAAKEYEKAIATAPWVAGYYSDLCTIYEKAERYAEAKKSCEFFLASSPSAQDASDVRKRIAGLEFAIEKAHSILGYWARVATRSVYEKDTPYSLNYEKWNSTDPADRYPDVMQIRQLGTTFEVNDISHTSSVIKIFGASNKYIEFFNYAIGDCQGCGIHKKCDLKEEYFFCTIEVLWADGVVGRRGEERYDRRTHCEPIGTKEHGEIPIVCQ